VVELEAGREAVRKELENVQRKMSAVDEEYQKKCREHQTTLEDQARVERQAAEQRRQLESALETAGAEVADLRVEMEAGRGRVEALEVQLSRTETSRRDAEWKLSSVVAELRRTVGIATGDAGERRSRSISPRKGSVVLRRFYSLSENKCIKYFHL